MTLLQKVPHKALNNVHWNGGHFKGKWNRCLTPFLLLCLGLAVPFSALGYVLQGPHVLSLMVEAMGGAETLLVVQEVVVNDPVVAEQPLVLKETLRYAFPDRFRSDTEKDGSKRLFVSSGGQTITVVDDHRDDGAQSRFDQYKDLLLYRNRQTMHKILLSKGIDVEKTSLGRFEDQIVYVIGAQFPDTASSQVWVDKERFLPLRWISVTPGDTDDRMEFVYKNWRKWDKVWYPMQIESFHNQRLVRKINVKTVTANPTFDSGIFDIFQLRTQYPVQEKTPASESTPSPADDVQRTIEEFQKKFDQ